MTSLASLMMRLQLALFRFWEGSLPLLLNLNLNDFSLQGRSLMMITLKALFSMILSESEARKLGAENLQIQILGFQVRASRT